MRVEGTTLRAEIRPQMTPRAAARARGRAIEQRGFVARVSENARIEPGADRTADVLVRRRDGQFAILEPPDDGRLTTDATMTACIGGVDLRDGLDHFVDVDAPAGTVEERALVKAFDDGDPSTIEVFMVPAFAGGGRIGESFIYADRSSVRNVVIEDRAGVRADRASFALAHELGHILLDMPGHPDDYGVDVPTLLMDSDAADPSAFGPRRLTIEECARAYRQSGPRAPVPVPLAAAAALKRSQWFGAAGDAERWATTVVSPGNALRGRGRSQRYYVDFLELGARRVPVAHERVPAEDEHADRRVAEHAVHPVVLHAGHHVGSGLASWSIWEAELAPVDVEPGDVPHAAAHCRRGAGRRARRSRRAAR